MTGAAITENWSRGDLFFVGVVFVVFVFGVVVPGVRRTRDVDIEVVEPPTAAQRRWRRPPD